MEKFAQIETTDGTRLINLHHIAWIEPSGDPDTGTAIIRLVATVNSVDYFTTTGSYNETVTQLQRVIA